jgi:hypothetical protein
MDVGDDWLSSREVPLSSPRNSPLPHPHFHYGLAVDRVLTFVHLETEEKGQEEGELRRGEKRSSSCGEMMRSGTGKAEKSEATFLPQPRAKKKERAKNCSPSLPPRLPVPASLRPIPSRHGLAPHDVGLHDLDALLRQPRRGCTSEFFVSKSERGGKSFDKKDGGDNGRRFHLNASRSRGCRAWLCSSTAGAHVATRLRVPGIVRTDDSRESTTTSRTASSPLLRSFSSL